MPRPNPILRDQVVGLRKSGLYPTEIAKQLGITRNQAIGICYRAGLSSADVDRSALGKLFCNPRRGEQHPNAKLTASEVAAIRREYVPWSREYGSVALAARYGVSAHTVAMIVAERAWKQAA